MLTFMCDLERYWYVCSQVHCIFKSVLIIQEKGTL